MFTKFFGVTNRNKFLNELEKVLKEKFPDKKDVDEIINSIGQANGIASLDDSGKVPSEQLPSYVDDIVEVEDYAHLPEIGETGKIYVTLDTGTQYRWGGSEYIPLNENSIQGIGIKKIIKLTQAEYDALTVKDINSIYLVECKNNGVFIAYTDNTISEYNILDSGKTPNGVALITDNTSIIIHPNNLTGGKWGPSENIPGVTIADTIQAASIDFNGKLNTERALAYGVSDAFTKATTLAFPDGSYGYLPSAGQLKEIMSYGSAGYNSMIVKAMNLIGGDNITYDPQSAGNDKSYWSSTQSSNSEYGNAWMWSQYNRSLFCNPRNESSSKRVRPVRDFELPKTYKLYLGSTFIISSEDTNRINNLEDKVTELESTTTNKADKPVSPTEGHLVKIDSLGNLLDAGLAIVKMTKTEYDALAIKNINTIYLVDCALPSFGGISICPAPLYYGANGFKIKDNDWNHNSFKSIKGLNEGSYYFSFLDLASYFDSRGSSFDWNSGNIDNANKISYGGYDDWRLPTRMEFIKLINYNISGYTHRNGCTVNGVSGYFYSRVLLSDVDIDTNLPNGLIIFPDDKEIFGVNLQKNYLGFDQNITNNQLLEYISQGCIVLPCTGDYGISWLNNWSTQSNSTAGIYMTNTVDSSARPYILNNGYSILIDTISNSCKDTGCGMVRLVSESAIIPKTQLYLGSILIADSNLPNEIETLLASI